MKLRLALKFAALTLTLALTACSSSSNQPLPVLSFAAQPTATQSTSQPLAYTLTAITNLNSGLTVALDDGQGHTFTVTFNQPNPPPLHIGNVTHTVDILGLRPNRTYTATISAFTQDNIVVPANQTLQLTTAALPADFPTITVLTAETARMETGFTMMDVAQKDGSAAYIVIFDNEGFVVWYLPQQVLSESERLAASELILTLDDSQGLIRFLNMNGTQQLAYHADQTHTEVNGSIPVDAANFHDDVVKHNLLNNFFVGTTDNSQQVMNYPLDEFDENITGTVNVLDEPIIEFNSLGTVIGTWDFLSRLKPTRIGYDGTNGEPDNADWVNLTSLVYDVLSDGIIASLRFQDAIVKIDRGTGDLVWILGNHDNWEGFESFLLAPDGNPLEWFYHQSTVEFTPALTVLVFDNGNRRASPFTGQPIVPADANQSRAVEYQVDESMMMVSQIWEWGLAEAGEQLYSTIYGDADRLPATGNTLITFGGLCEVGGVPSDDLAVCRSTGRIIEVEDQTNERVFDVIIDDADPMSMGVFVNRSERLREVYTAFQGNLIVTVTRP